MPLKKSKPAKTKIETENYLLVLRNDNYITAGNFIIKIYFSQHFSSGWHADWQDALQSVHEQFSHLHWNKSLINVSNPTNISKKRALKIHES